MEMNTYKIKIVETLEKVVILSSKSKQEAIKIVVDDYNNEKHVLDYNNHISTDFERVI